MVPRAPSHNRGKAVLTHPRIKQINKWPDQQGILKINSCQRDRCWESEAGSREAPPALNPKPETLIFSIGQKGEFEVTHFVRNISADDLRKSRHTNRCWIIVTKSHFRCQCRGIIGPKDQCTSWLAYWPLWSKRHEMKCAAIWSFSNNDGRFRLRQFRVSSRFLRSCIIWWRM